MAKCNNVRSWVLEG